MKYPCSLYPPGHADWHEVEADAPDEAAEMFAQQRDSEGDYTIAKNGYGEIWVMVNGAPKKYDIEAESVPEYTAREAAPPSPQSAAR